MIIPPFVGLLMIGLLVFAFTAFLLWEYGPGGTAFILIGSLAFSVWVIVAIQIITGGFS